MLGCADMQDIWSPDSEEGAGKNSRAHAAQASPRLNCASRDLRDTVGQESFPREHWLDFQDHQDEPPPSWTHSKESNKREGLGKGGHRK